MMYYDDDDVLGSNWRLSSWKLKSVSSTSYRIKPLLLVQELSKVLWGGTQHALLLKVLYSSLWFLVKPVKYSEAQNIMKPLHATTH